MKIVASLAWWLLLHAAHLAADPAVEILKPPHQSVVRRQSVEIEVAIHSMQVPMHGFGRLSIDGIHFSDVTRPHLSFIVADERVMAEGVHTLQVSLFRADGHPLVRSSSHPDLNLTLHDLSFCDTRSSSWSNLRLLLVWHPPIDPVPHISNRAWPQRLSSNLRATSSLLRS